MKMTNRTTPRKPRRIKRTWTPWPHTLRHAVCAAAAAAMTARVLVFSEETRTRSDDLDRLGGSAFDRLQDARRREGSP